MKAQFSTISRTIGSSWVSYGRRRSSPRLPRRSISGPWLTGPVECLGGWALLSVSLPECKCQELFPGIGASEKAAHYACRHQSVAFDSAHLHAKMLAACKNRNVTRICDGRDLVSNLMHQSLLHLQPVRIFVCYASKLRKPENVLGCDVGHGNFAPEGKQVVLAQAKNRD